MTLTRVRSAVMLRAGLPRRGAVPGDGDDAGDQVRDRPHGVGDEVGSGVWLVTPDRGGHEVPPAAPPGGTLPPPMMTRACR